MKHKITILLLFLLCFGGCRKVSVVRQMQQKVPASLKDHFQNHVKDTYGVDLDDDFTFTIREEGLFNFGKTIHFIQCEDDLTCFYAVTDESKIVWLSIDGEPVVEETTDK